MPEKGKKLKINSSILCDRIKFFYLCNNSLRYGARDIFFDVLLTNFYVQNLAILTNTKIGNKHPLAMLYRYIALFGVMYVCIYIQRGLLVAYSC